MSNVSVEDGKTQMIKLGCLICSEPNKQIWDVAIFNINFHLDTPLPAMLEGV